MSTLDFTKSSAWGRAFHPSTMSVVEPSTLKERLLDWWEGAKRISFLCHYPTWPEEGDTVIWEAQDYYVRAPVVHVHHFHDPKDMYKVTVRITTKHRIKK